MKRSDECATMTLNYDITGAITDADLTGNFTLNLRKVLGNMYDKYHYFTIVLTSIGGYNDLSGTKSNSISLNTNAVYMLGLQGLVFPMNTTTANNNSSLGIFPGRFNMAYNGSYLNVNLTNSSNGLVFIKPDQSNVSISISLLCTRTMASTVGTMPATNGTTTSQFSLNYTFNIYGLVN